MDISKKECTLYNYTIPYESKEKYNIYNCNDGDNIINCSENTNLNYHDNVKYICKEDRLPFITTNDINIKNQIMESGDGILYLCDVQKLNLINVIYKKMTREGKKTKQKLDNINNNMDKFVELNKHDVFMKTYAFVKTDDIFDGLIMENLSEYKTIESDLCGARNKMSSILLQTLVVSFLHACKILFSLDICSPVEHGNNIMFHPKSFAVKIIDLDDIGDDPHLFGCKNNMQKQYDSIMQLFTFLMNCIELGNIEKSELTEYITYNNSHRNELVFAKQLDGIHVTYDYRNIDGLLHFWELTDIAKKYISLTGGHINLSNDYYKKKYLKYKSKYLKYKLKINKTN